MNTVPTTGRVMGILTIIFTSLALLGGLFGLAGAGMWNAMTSMAETVPDAEFEIFTNVFSAAAGITTVVTALQLGTNGVGLAAGIGLVSGKRWSITASNVYAVGIIVLNIGGYVIAQAVATNAMNSMMSMYGGSDMRATMLGTELISSIGGVFGFFGIVIGSAYPIVLLSLINRRKVRDAYLQDRAQ